MPFAIYGVSAVMLILVSRVIWEPNIHSNSPSAVDRDAQKKLVSPALFIIGML